MVMRKSGKIVAILISLSVIMLGGLVFLYNIKNISIPKAFTTISSIELMDTVNIYTNQHGVPHIIANSKSDMFFSIGYLQAQERLWQMDIIRRAGRGKLSEIFGKEALNFDLFIRALELEKTADKNIEVLSKESIQILDAYSKGVNEFIEQNVNKLSFEFGALSYLPEKWQPEDCIIVGKMLAFELSLGFYFDIAFAEIAEKIGKDKAKRLLPSYPDEAPFVTDNIVKVRNYEILRELPQILDTNDIDIDSTNIDLSFISGFSDHINSIREYIGIEGSSIGSNSWARRKDLSSYSPTILANDPHLPLGLPARWLPAQATCPDFNVFGFMVPGIPLFLVGRNDEIAWGVTSMMLDDCDFFIEQLDDNDKYYFERDSVRAELSFVIDTIFIKNELPHIYYRRLTSRSQLISDVHLFNRVLDDLSKEKDNKYLKSKALSFRWTGNEVNDDIIAIYKINIASNFDDFTKAVQKWTAPALSFTYSDRSGNIGIVPSGLVPNRGSECDANFPNIASNPNALWKGYLDSKSLPIIYNPKKNFVASANNKIANLPFHLTSHWEPSARAERIDEVIMEGDDYTTRDAQYMQNDLLSIYAKKHFVYLIPVFEKYAHLFDKNEMIAYEKFMNWDLILTSNSSEATIYNIFLERLIYNTFYDELGKENYEKFLLISSFALRKILEISSEPFNEWFDDVRTNEREMRDYVIIKSFKDAILKGNEIFGTDDIEEWRWGDIHKLTLNHRFSQNKLLNSIVSVGPFNLGGNSTTLNNTEYRIAKSFDVVVGSSMRFIADMGDNNVYISMPGGVSGDPLNPNYSNLVQIWLNGGYLRIPFKSTPSDKFYLTMTLEPKI